MVYTVLSVCYVTIISCTQGSSYTRLPNNLSYVLSLWLLKISCFLFLFTGYVWDTKYILNTISTWIWDDNFFLIMIWKIRGFMTSHSVKYVLWSYFSESWRLWREVVLYAFPYYIHVNMVYNSVCLVSCCAS